MRQDYCEAHFLRKKQGMWARSTASHINLQWPWTHDALSLKKHMESGRVSATHVLVEKRYGIRERLVACHMNLQSHCSRDAFYLRKHKESGGVGTTSFSLKNTRNWRGRSSVTYKFTVKMKPRRNLYGIHNDFSAVAGGLRRGCILIRNRDGDVNVRWSCTHVACYATASRLPVHTCSMLRQWWGGGGVGMSTFAEVAHMLHATQLRLGCPCTRARCYASDGVGWGGDVNVRWSQQQWHHESDSDRSKCTSVFWWSSLLACHVQSAWYQKFPC